MGEVTQTLDVVGTAPVIDTESPTIGSVVDQKKVVELPLNGRNFMELTTLFRKASMKERAPLPRAGFLRKGFAPAAAGMPATENNYQLDGADNKEGFFNTFNVAPSVDAVQEFKIQIGQYSAEFGSGGGAVINVVTKSGTNGFHGTFGSSSATTNWMRVISSFPRQRTKRRYAEISSASPRAVRSRKIALSSLATTTALVNGAAFSVALGFQLPAQIAGDLSGLGKVIRGSCRQDCHSPTTSFRQIASVPFQRAWRKYYGEVNNAQPDSELPANLIQPGRCGFLSLRVDHRLVEQARLHVALHTPGSRDLRAWHLHTSRRRGIPQRFQNIVLGLTSTLTPNASQRSPLQLRAGPSTDNRVRIPEHPIAADLGIPFAPRDEINAGFPEGIGLYKQRSSAELVEAATPGF